MTWLEELSIRFSGPKVVQTDRVFVEDGCNVNLASLPDSSIVLRVDGLNKDGLNKKVNWVADLINASHRCDYVVISDLNSIMIVDLLEMKSSVGHPQRALSQLISSLEILNQAIDSCAIEIPKHEIRSAVVGPIPHKPALDQIRSHIRKLLQKSKFVYIADGDDIWKTFQQESPLNSDSNNLH